jgi:hypothetical protein
MYNIVCKKNGYFTVYILLAPVFFDRSFQAELSRYNKMYLIASFIKLSFTSYDRIMVFKKVRISAG